MESFWRNIFRRDYFLPFFNIGIQNGIKYFEKFTQEQKLRYIDFLMVVLHLENPNTRTRHTVKVAFLQKSREVNYFTVKMFWFHPIFAKTFFVKSTTPYVFSNFFHKNVTFTKFFSKSVRENFLFFNIVVLKIFIPPKILSCAKICQITSGFRRAFYYVD